MREGRYRAVKRWTLGEKITHEPERTRLINRSACDQSSRKGTKADKGPKGAKGPKEGEEGETRPGEGRPSRAEGLKKENKRVKRTGRRMTEEDVLAVETLPHF